MAAQKNTLHEAGFEPARVSPQHFECCALTARPFMLGCEHVARYVAFNGVRDKSST